jgi:hypothetical protein
VKEDTKAITTTSQLVVSGITGTANYPSSAILKNATGGATIFLGGKTVTTANGFPLAGGESLAVDLVNEELYGVAASAVNLYILRRGA